jgi:2-amino-4-hydroxy-6-hydroxymethyldihydropteridine diphosphokinase
LILIALGANLATERYGPPEKGLDAALRALEAKEIHVVRRSRWYRSAPVPPSDQPWYVNGVAVIETDRTPAELLDCLLEVERSFGRRRRRAERNEARVLDLDLLAYGERVDDDIAAGLILPHPRMHERAFVLRPLSEIAPDWNHPVLGRSAIELCAGLGGSDVVEPIAGDDATA